MQRWLRWILVAGWAWCLAPNLSAQVVLLDMAWNRNGVISSTVPTAGTFDRSTGLGSIELTFNGPGQHFGFIFVDYEMSATRNTFFNEWGAISPEPAPPGLEWEIDEPGYVVGGGNIYRNFVLATLDKSIGVPGPDDIAMAIGWRFVMDEGGVARIIFNLTGVAPSGFYLRHWDPDSGEEVFLSSALWLSYIPEPAAGTLSIGLGLAGWALWLSRRRMDSRRPRAE